MKKRRTINSSYGFAAAGATMLLAAANSHAQILNNFYFGADGGGAIQQDMSIRNGTGFGGPGGNIKFNGGWTGGGFVGYTFCDYFSAQLNSGVIWNNITTVGNQSLSSVGNAHLEEVPLLISGIFTYPMGNFKPHVGLGVGGAFTTFDSSGIPFSGPGPNPTYNDTDTTFAWQAQLGFSYVVNKHFEIGLDYRFLGTTEHSWNDNGINLQSGATKTHLIEATFTFRF